MFPDQYPLIRIKLTRVYSYVNIRTVEGTLQKERESCQFRFTLGHHFSYMEVRKWGMKEWIDVELPLKFIPDDYDDRTIILWMGQNVAKIFRAVQMSLFMRGLG